MNLESFDWMCKTYRPAAIVLQRHDYEQLRAALPDGPGEWDKEKMRYRGAPIVRGDFFHSYIVEDTPEGPMCRMLG